MTIREHTFRAIGGTNSVFTTDATTLKEAARLTEAMVDELDRATSRFRSDSELSRVNASASERDVHIVVSELLGGCIAAALHAADITEGLVDPTVGQAVIATGYDDDLDAVRARTGRGELDPGIEATVLGWRSVAYDPATRLVSLPRGTVLDLGATAKAYAADLIAATLARQPRGGFLVNLGGDIAVSGLLPVGGWDIGVEDERGVVRQVVVSTGQAVATSSTRHRTWTSAGAAAPHHRPADRPYRLGGLDTGTCAGVSAVEANSASTAASSWVLDYAAGETAGQCGPCMFEVPAVAADFALLTSWRADRAVVQRLQGRLGLLPGRGACRFPEGVAGYAGSALRIFASEVDAHLTGRCAAGSPSPRSPLTPGRDHAVAV